MSDKPAEDSTYILRGDDPEENARLSHQAKAIQLAQDGKLTTLDLTKFLDVGTGGEGSTVLDMACGPANWVMDFASRYPNSEVHAFDIVPRWKTGSSEVPPNLSLFEHDYFKPLDQFPDNSFDIVRLGTTSGGLPTKESYDTVYKEAARLLKPGGWLISAAEPMMDGWRLMDPESKFDHDFGKIALLSEEDTKERAPGFYAIGKALTKSMREGPMRVLSNAGTDVVPGVLGVIDSLDPSTMVQHTVAVPFSGWSNDPVFKAAGEAMRPDAAQIPKALKALLMSAYGGTDDEKSAQFEKDVTAYTADIDTPGTAIIFTNNSIQKRGGPSSISSAA